MQRPIYPWALSLGLIGAIVGGGPAHGKAPRVGDVVPDFSLEQFGGSQVSLSDFRDKVVTIYFFGYN